MTCLKLDCKTVVFFFVGILAREPYKLFSVPLSVYTLAPDFSFEDGAYSYDRPSPKSTSVLQSCINNTFQLNM